MGQKNVACNRSVIGQETAIRLKKLHLEHHPPQEGLNDQMPRLQPFRTVWSGKRASKKQLFHCGSKKNRNWKVIRAATFNPWAGATSPESGGTKNADDSKSTLQNADAASLLDLGDGVLVFTFFIEDASWVEVVAREMLSANPGCNEGCDFSQKIFDVN